MRARTVNQKQGEEARVTDLSSRSQRRPLPLQRKHSDAPRVMLIKRTEVRTGQHGLRQFIGNRAKR